VGEEWGRAGEQSEPRSEAGSHHRVPSQAGEAAGDRRRGQGQKGTGSGSNGASGRGARRVPSPMLSLTPVQTLWGVSGHPTDFQLARSDAWRGYTQSAAVLAGPRGQIVAHSGLAVPVGPRPCVSDAMAALSGISSGVGDLAPSGPAHPLTLEQPLWPPLPALVRGLAPAQCHCRTDTQLF